MSISCTSTSSTAMSYILVSNIPKSYHAKDLRNFFNEMIESGSFECFHYRHRPQVSLDQLKTNMFWGVICLSSHLVKTMFEKYHLKYWITKDGDNLNVKCILKQLKVDSDCQNIELDNHNLSSSSLRSKLELMKQYKNSKREAKRKACASIFNDSSDNSVITMSELKTLLELNPPKDVMPHGNVGTSSSIFLNLIRECRLPTKLISNLDLEFPRSYRRKIYSNVAFDYKTKTEATMSETNSEEHAIVKSKNGIILSSVACDENKSNSTSQDEKLHKEEEDDSDSNSDDEQVEREDGEEEWDRHVAIHPENDQERDKERLFEDEIELKWEKGGSGLVFYTDAQYWNMQEGDFDEQTADDLDVDISKPGVHADADANQRYEMTMEKIDLPIHAKRKKSARNNYDSDDDEKKKKKHGLGYFERYTKGIGRKIMEKQGWKEGCGIGKSMIGCVDPIGDKDGQKPSDKSGIGYRGDKLNNYS